MDFLLSGRKQKQEQFHTKWMGYYKNKSSINKLMNKYPEGCSMKLSKGTQRRTTPSPI